MIKVVIRKNGVETNAIEVESMEAASAWLAPLEAKQYFGKPERWVPESELTPDEISNSIDAEERLYGGRLEVFYKFNSEYVVEYIDVTEAKAAQRRLERRIQAQDFGALFIAKVIEINSAKYVAGLLSGADLAQLDLDPVIARMERAAWRGDIESLLDLVDNYVGSFYTDDERTALAADIRSYLSSRGQ